MGIREKKMETTIVGCVGFTLGPKDLQFWDPRVHSLR